MDREGYLKFHKDKCDEARALSARKNHDYADPGRREDDPLAVWANFMLCEKLGICSTEAGLLVRISDKFMRLSNLLDPGHERAVGDESIEDTENDLINYTILLSGYRKAKKELAEEKTNVQKT